MLPTVFDFMMRHSVLILIFIFTNHITSDISNLQTYKRELKAYADLIFDKKNYQFISLKLKEINLYCIDITILKKRNHNTVSQYELC